MLAEIKPDIKPEAAEADLDILDKQIKAFQQRLQSQTVLPSQNTQTTNDDKENIQTSNQATNEDSVVNFGWDEMGHGFPIPFIKRGSENFVANHIVGELVYKRIQEDFSKEMLFCMAIIMERMSKREADTFNEININHCDRSIVGSHYFKAGEYMIKLEHVRKMNEYYKTCRNLVICKCKENNLFGFIEIGGENQVPFVWSGEQKLVPLFYFEGQSEYLDSKSQDLTDPFEIGYVKFCCKVQKIKKDYYEHNPLKVVDFEEVKKLFHAETTFQIQLPKSVNQDLLAPEVRVAFLHGTEEKMQTPQDSTAIVSINSNSCEPEKNMPHEPLNSSQEQSDRNNINLHKTVPNSSTQNSKAFAQESRLGQLQGGKENNSEPIDNKTLQTEFQRYIEHTRGFMSKELAKSPQKRPTQFVGEIEPKRPKIAMVSEQVPKSLTSSLIQFRKVQTPQHIENPQQAAHPQGSNVQYVLRKSSDITITPIPPGSSNQQNSFYINKEPSEVAVITPIAQTFTETNQYVKCPTSNSHITNVPYKSPRVASSPGCNQTNPFKNETAQRVPIYSQSNIMPGTEMLTRPIQPSYVPSSVLNKPNSKSYQRYDTYHFNGNTIQHHPLRQYNITSQQQNYTRYPIQYGPMILPSGPCGPNYYRNTTQMTSASVSHNRATPPPNVCVVQFPNSFSNLMQKFWQNSQKQKFQEGQMQQCTNFHLSSHNQNFQTDPVFNPLGYQNNGPYFQQYNGAPVTQNINFSSSNVICSQNNVQNYNSTTLASTRTSNMHTDSFQTQDGNNNITRNPFTVVEHPPFLDSNPELYTIKYCVVRGKTVLAIKKSPIIVTFLVNLSEFVEKVLGLNPFGNHTELPSKFTTCYKLNSIQKIQWDKALKERQFECVGNFKDVFIDFSEISSC